MFFNKKKSKAEKKEDAKFAVEFDPSQDFKYVEVGASVHDRRFNARPTTFLKDALKRFTKNRSSVVGFWIIAILMAMAIIVPLADQNDINASSLSSSYLPPKWWDVNGAGFLDGTGSVQDVVIDPATKGPAATTAYVTHAIVGGLDGIHYHDETYNLLSETIEAYGHGGSVLVRTDTLTKNAGIYSPTFSYDNTENYTLAIALNDEANSGTSAHNPNYVVNLYADLNKDGVLETEIPLMDYSTTYQDFTLNSTTIAAKVAADASYIAAGSPSTFTSAIDISIKTSQDPLAYPALYIDSVNLSSDLLTDFSAINFSDAVKMMSNTTNAWKISGSGTQDVYHAILTLGDFRYDYYNAAFGEDTYVFDADSIKEFIAKGWMTYTFSDKTTSGDYAPGAFALTAEGEIYCPVRAISKESIVVWQKMVVVSLTCTRSLYRYDYYKGLISRCAMPQYFFGTDANGRDFFKIVFSGLLTSLELGVLCAIINFSFGLIWGAVSGYFGGWVDIIMERFTEILGGMPWIVLMTLIAMLMGSTFWTFLFALCLTGWMGVAGMTRSQFYRFKDREYVLASRTLGASDARLIFRHILPNGVGTIVTATAFMIPGVIFSEATISYLLPTAFGFKGTSFGVTLSNAQGEIALHPYMIVSASIVMMLIMISFNLFGNGLRDAFNPSLKGSNE